MISLVALLVTLVNGAQAAVSVLVVVRFYDTTLQTLCDVGPKGLTVSGNDQHASSDGSRVLPTGSCMQPQMSMRGRHFWHNNLLNTVCIAHIAILQSTPDIIMGLACGDTTALCLIRKPLYNADALKWPGLDLFQFGLS